MKQWPKSLLNVEKMQTPDCVTIEHPFFKELHQTFEPSIWPESTNPCTRKWYFIKWMMASRTPSNK
jgi:hypothetical protein